MIELVEGKQHVIKELSKEVFVVSWLVRIKWSKKISEMQTVQIEGKCQYLLIKNTHGLLSLC